MDDCPGMSTSDAIPKYNIRLRVLCSTGTRSDLAGSHIHQCLSWCKSIIMPVGPYKKAERRNSLYMVLAKIGCVPSDVSPHDEIDISYKNPGSSHYSFQPANISP